MSNPTMRVIFNRFSSHAGYGYTVSTEIRYVNMWGNSKVLFKSHKTLHCTLGCNCYQCKKAKYEIKISSDTLRSLEKFCESHGGFFGCIVNKELKDYDWRKSNQIG